MAYDTLLSATSRHTLTVTLHRPSRRNALDDTMLGELHAALDAAEGSEDCRLLVLRGAGGVFCAGMDLEDAAHEIALRSASGRARFFQLLRRFTMSSCVVVAIVDGRADGGGVGLAAACDFVFASECARFALPEALWGLVPSSVLPFLVRRTGPRLAYAMMLSTLPVDAHKAEQVGLVDAVAEDPEPLLHKLASRVTRIDPATIAAAKRSFARLAPIGDDIEAAAMSELDELLGSPLVKRAITRLLGPRRSLPWEP
ncbi:MAG: enoyl-CoA hydratase [Deltaproteobacteria bacterium]|nr:MAG: enoyl-CoA hydratase [Deltaproteobacteria bacterium]